MLVQEGTSPGIILDQRVADHKRNNEDKQTKIVLKESPFSGETEYTLLSAKYTVHNVL